MDWHIGLIYNRYYYCALTYQIEYSKKHELTTLYFGFLNKYAKR